MIRCRIRECRRGPKRYRVSRITKETCKWKSRGDAEAQRGCQAKRGAYPFSVGQSRENERTEAEMEAELQSLQAGGERRGSNASHGVNCCREAVAEQLGIMGAEKAMYHFEILRGMLQIMSEAQTPPEQMPGKGGGEQRNPATDGG